MSSLSSIRRQITRTLGFQNRVTFTQEVGITGVPYSKRHTRRLRSWAIHRDGYGWVFTTGQHRTGTNPGHRYQRRKERRARAQIGGAK